MPPCTRCTWRRFALFAFLCLLISQLHSFFLNVSVQVEKMNRILSLQPLALRELEDVEQLILLPPHGLRVDHTFDFNQEYLNSSSSLSRSIFFPAGAVDPGKDDGYFSPGKTWLDTDGNPIQAHGGSVMLDPKSLVYYWYGEYKNGPTYKTRVNVARVDIIGVACYSSMNLMSWKYEGIALAAEVDKDNQSHDLYKTKVLERPKVLYNDRTGKYVMWMHIDDESYSKAAVGVAISDSPKGPFEYLHSFKPNGHESRDMTVFKDDDGMAHLIYSSNRNKEIHVSPMSLDFLSVDNVTVRAMVGQYREAPALFKYENVYYMVTSGCSGWAPNEAVVHEAESMFGPWESIGNPCVGANKQFRVATFFSQGTCVIPMPGGAPGSFIFMADRWKPDDLRDSRYVWLPMVVNSRTLRYSGLPLWSRVSIFWHKKWRIGDNGKVHVHIDEW